MHGELAGSLNPLKYVIYTPLPVKRHLLDEAIGQFWLVSEVACDPPQQIRLQIRKEPESLQQHMALVDVRGPPQPRPLQLVALQTAKLASLAGNTKLNHGIAVWGTVIAPPPPSAQCALMPFIWTRVAEQAIEI